MKRTQLTQQDKEELELRHTQCQGLKEGARIKAVLLRSEGWTVPMISQALRLHESKIIRHLNDYRAEKLNNESGGSRSDLSDSQTEELVAHLEEVTYHHAHEIVHYVKSTFGVTYSIPGMNKWLHRNGFNYKKPKGHPHKANCEQQAEFIKAYQAFIKHLNPDDRVYFSDRHTHHKRPN